MSARCVTCGRRVWPWQRQGWHGNRHWHAPGCIPLGKPLGEMMDRDGVQWFTAVTCPKPDCYLTATHHH